MTTLVGNGRPTVVITSARWEQHLGVQPVSLVDHLPWLCTASTCPARIDGRIAYFDDDHLSASQSAALGWRWTTILEDLLGADR